MKRLRVLAAISVFTGVCVAQDPIRSLGWVVIPIHEYETLHGRAYPSVHETEGPPVEATLTRVDYDLRVENPGVSSGSVATGQASLTVDVLKDGWVRVPIPQGLLVREARLGGQLVSLMPIRERPGQLSAVLSRRGRALLQLDVAFPVTSGGGEEHLSLPVGASGVTRASVFREFPSRTSSTGEPQDVELKVAGGFVAEKTAGHWLAYARGSEPLVFTWRRKTEEQRAVLPLRTRGSLVQLFGLGEDSTSLNAEVELEVVQGSAHQVKIAVPDSVIVNQVPGANVADWDLKNGELVVNFLEPVESSVKFAISGEARLPREGNIGVPLLRLLDSERDAGGTAVEVLGAGEIKDSRIQGMEPVEAADLGTLVRSRQSPSLAAFRLRAGAPVRSLNVVVARYAQQAVLTANVEEARYRILMTEEGKTLVQARYAVRNNQRNFVRIALPMGALVWSSSLAGRPVRPGQAEDGSLLIPLSKGRAGEEAPLFAIEILYLARGDQWSTKGHSALALPTLDLPISRTGVVLHYPPLFRVTPETGAFRTELYAPPASDPLKAQTAISPTAPANAGSASAEVSSRDATQMLVDRYRAKSDARRNADAIPIRVTFPSVGPSLFLVSELTGESKGAVVNLSYQKDKKGGVK